MTTARTYNELFEQPHHLTLERESARMWIVVDHSRLFEGEPAVMIRTPDRDLAERFMDAFVEKTPGATWDRATVEHSWRVAQEATSHDHRANVYRLRPHEPLDETA